MTDASSHERRARMRKALAKAGHEPASARLRADVLAAAMAEVASASPSRGGDTSAVSKTATSGVLGKVFGAIGIIAAIGGTTRFVVRAPVNTEAHVPPVVTAAVHEDAPSSAGEPPSRPAEVSTLSVDALPNVPTRAPSIPRSAPTAALARPSAESAPAPSSAGRLAEEMHLVDSIRSAAKGGDTQRAWKLLEEHQARFPSGALSEETDALRIETLHRLGRSQSAAELARRFLSERPSSPYARRVQATLARVNAATPADD